MQRFSSILLWSLLLFAVTAIVLPSCNVSRKSGSQRTAAEGDSLSDEASSRRAFLNELGEEEYGPLPSGWERPSRRERRKKEKEERAAQATAPDSTLVSELPGETELSDSTGTTPARQPGSRPSRPASPLTSEEPTQGEAADSTAAEPAGGGERGPSMKTVDYTADLMRNLQITEDSSAVTMIGNVVFYHNGAVITCDSAVRFSEKRMEFYKRVVINNGTTYVYGDRAEYNGEINMARVYSPIVKVVDEEAVLYTYNFSYNTYTEIGRYWGGGTLTHNDSRMESLRGYYNTNTREFTGAGEVELTNPDYKLVSDSVLYNLDTEIAEFFVPSVIWNSKGEILMSDRGKYRSPTADYEFNRNSYILTDTQEIWADSMRHYSNEDYTVMHRDIQIIDEENSSMAFGDYGEYFGETEYGMLTINPSILSYDSEVEEPDTIYMRSDSMFFYTFPHDQVFEGLHNAPAPDTTSEFEELMERPLPPPGEGMDEQSDPEAVAEGETEGQQPGEEEQVVESEDGQVQAEEGPPDDPSPPVEPVMTKKQQKKADRKAAKEAKTNRGEQGITEESPQAATEETSALEESLDGLLSSTEMFADSIAVAGLGDLEPETDGQEPEEAVVAAPEPYVSPYADLVERLHRLVASDSVQRAMAPEEFWVRVRDEIREDSTRMDYYFYAVDDALTSGEIDTEVTDIPTGGLQAIIDTVMSESELVIASIPEVVPPSDREESDSVQRVFYGYHNVRIYRNDFQAVCDSIVGFSKDSTLHMHVEPVMWSDQNQVVSDIMIIYTKDEQLYKAEFYGSPFMSSEVDSLENRYNQIKGKFMTSWFRDNDIYKHDVQGNGQTHYYMEDDATGEVQGFMVCESADITFFIEESQIDEIIYRWDPDYVIYPIDMVPADVDQILPGFTWEAHRRPRTKEDVFTRSIRPRQREEVLAMPQPEFPLTENIENRKEELTRLNMWRDRNDTLSPLALEFVRETELKYAEQQMQ